jgi:hypothetical protein
MENLPSAALRRDSTDVSIVGFIRVIGVVVAIRKETVYVAHDDCISVCMYVDIIRLKYLLDVFLLLFLSYSCAICIAAEAEEGALQIKCNRGKREERREERRDQIQCTVLVFIYKYVDSTNRC